MKRFTLTFNGRHVMTSLRLAELLGIRPRAVHQAIKHELRSPNAAEFEAVSQNLTLSIGKKVKQNRIYLLTQRGAELLLPALGRDEHKSRILSAFGNTGE